MNRNNIITILAAALLPGMAWAQLDNDALLMGKGDLCTGPMYMHNSWTNYWEGTLKRENLNIGTMTTHSISLMGMYGVNKKLSVFYNFPYVVTHSNAGNWKGQRGLQDASLWLKFKGYTHQVGSTKLSAIGMAGISTPMSNYSMDMLPYSLGLGSTNLSARLLLDVQRGKWFATAGATYIHRSNVKLDRTAYYTTQMVYSQWVHMPNATQWHLRTGYRTSTTTAELVAENFTTQGGFDITRNNMPFISNRMNATRLGVHLKKEGLIWKPFTLMAGGNYVVQGRNVGQSTTLYTGAAWLFPFKPKAANKKAGGM